MKLEVKKVDSRYWLRTEKTPKMWEAYIDSKMVATAFTKRDATNWGNAQLDWLKRQTVSVCAP